VVNMPIVRVTMFEGRGREKKRRLVAGITDVVAEVCEVERASVEVIIEEVSRDDWGFGGVLGSERPGAQAAGDARGE
jgi:4-oxalocrotonate tautomerase family enzyme